MIMKANMISYIEKGGYEFFIKLHFMRVCVFSWKAYVVIITTAQFYRGKNE